jgi:two-component system, chemotaxis family, chemotaxis protein CheY
MSHAGDGGLECVKAMRRNAKTRLLKILMVTAEVDHIQIEAALEAGADEYLMKLFNEAALMEKLRMIGIG